ncbi:LPS export ABC transporter periplasmic protein LptC [Solitalea lacus]|uniref:LPS export ABC transporter periplasmic protein LptC n=1 Tax=Solitalea lacus TaxID=2911172 RepID=UPI001EDADF6C|nr:LPS export ABC transporter periplasmic protein LptC [Solitalea lacus]UKJ08215.1 LPS export ABC transporter periplasmic protein LptC [Solitalea lacus]
MKRARLIVMIGAGMAFTACENDLAKVNAISAKITEKSVETSKGVEMIYSDSAKVKARLTTPLLLQYKTEKPYDEMPKGLKVEFFAPNTSRVESTITARYGIRQPNERKIEVRDSVVVVNSKGDKLTSERLVWDEDKHIIYSDKFVKIISPDKIVQGYGFEAPEDLSVYKFKKLSGEVDLKQPTVPQQP